MPIKITELPEIVNGDINQTDLLIIYDSIQEKTSTIKADGFRGMSVYSSPQPPDPNNHVNPDLSSYTNGDVYIYDKDAYAIVYRYDASTIKFIEVANLRVPTTFTDTTLPKGLTYSAFKTGSIYKDNTKFINGDYVKDEQEGVTYGPYSEADGFRFAKFTRAYTVNRSPKIFKGTADPDITLTDYPVSGDMYLKTLTNGSVVAYAYDESLEASSDWDTAVVQGWGDAEPFNTKGIVPIDTLEVDDTKFSTGDYAIYDVNKTPLLYGPYVSGESTVANAWGTPAILRSPLTAKVSEVPTNVSAIADFKAWSGDYVEHTNTGDNKPTYRYTITAISELGEITYDLGTLLTKPRLLTLAGDAVPSKDDTTYVAGDVALNSYGTRFGPYVTSAANDTAAWPLGSLGEPYLHEATLSTSTGSPSAKPSDYTPFLRTGDVIEGTFNNVKYRWDVTGAGDPFAQETNGTLSNKRSSAGVQWHTEATLAQPVKDDTKYAEGDYIINLAGAQYGPYSPGESTDAVAWPEVFKPATGLVLNDATAGKNYTLGVDNGTVYLEEV